MNPVSSKIIATYREAATQGATDAGADSTVVAAVADAVEDELNRPFTWTVALRSGIRLSWAMGHAEALAFQADVAAAAQEGREFVSHAPAWLLLRTSAVESISRGAAVAPPEAAA
jgi:hypothetical protein